MMMIMVMLIKRLLSLDRSCQPPSNTGTIPYKFLECCVFIDIDGCTTQHYFQASLICSFFCISFIIYTTDW